MLNFAKQAFSKHKEIDIAYKMKQQNDKVTDKDIDEMIEKYQNNVGFSIKAVDMSPTGAKEENKVLTNEKVE